MTEVTTMSVATPNAIPISEKIGDDRHKPLAFARTQVAAGNHPFKGAKHSADPA